MLAPYVAHFFRSEAVWCGLAFRFGFKGHGLRCKHLSYIAAAQRRTRERTAGEEKANRDTKLLETVVTRRKQTTAPTSNRDKTRLFQSAF